MNSGLEIFVARVYLRVTLEAGRMGEGFRTLLLITTHFKINTSIQIEEETKEKRDERGKKE